MFASSWSNFRRLLGNGRDQLTFEIVQVQREAAEKALRLSESQFRILVESVADYAIYIAGHGWPGHDLEPRRGKDQRVRRERNHRAAFLPLLRPRRSPEGDTAKSARKRRPRRAI